MKLPNLTIKKKHRWLIGLPVFLFVVGAGMFVVGNESEEVEEVYESEEVQEVEEVESGGAGSGSAGDQVLHTELPEEVRGIYWTGYTAGTSRGEVLLDYMVASGLNSVVIDLKMDNGQLAFDPVNDDLDAYVMNNPAIQDLEALTTRLYEAGIYRIARIPVMRDNAFAYQHPELSMKNAGGGYWQDSIGSLWIDPASSEVADYAIALAREAYSRGFDEVQFDYVRFASDGAINAIVYPVYDQSKTKVEVMQDFFEKVGGAMQEDGIPVSFDLFGMTYWSSSGYNIGQRLLDTFFVSDWTSAMVYPSHYPNGFKGMGNPAEYPYEIVKMTMDKGAEMISGVYSGTESEIRTKFRPWLQDFDIGAVYTSWYIEEQIRATHDAGASGWILWNARNVYEPANYLQKEN